MKPKLFVLVVVLLLLALVPALVSGASQAKPSKTGSVKIDIRQPIGPQLDAQLGVGAKGPRSARMVNLSAPRGGNTIQPNAVYGLLNDSFENGAGNWGFLEQGASPVGWDVTDDLAKRGQYSLYSAAYGNDPYVNPFYDDDMLSWAYTDMDLQGAQRIQIRFQHRTDTELGYDAFYWCGSADGFNYYCDYFTGSTNGKWRLVQWDSKTNPVAASMLGSPFASFAFVFESDFIFTDTGTFVDPVRIRAWGPSPSN